MVPKSSSTLNGRYAPYCRKYGSFGAHCKNLNEWRQTHTISGKNVGKWLLFGQSYCYRVWLAISIMMSSWWRHQNKTHSWYSELNSLQSIYFGFLIFWKLTEWCRFETYLCDGPRISTSSILCRFSHWFCLTFTPYNIQHWCATPQTCVYNYREI